MHLPPDAANIMLSAGFSCIKSKEKLWSKITTKLRTYLNICQNTRTRPKFCKIDPKFLSLACWRSETSCAKDFKNQEAYV